MTHSKPVTRWKEEGKSNNEKNGPSPTWVKCRQCGREMFAYLDKDADPNGFLCGKCRKGDYVAEEEKVSFRCRRHKKRFEVEKSWLSICSYLCPKCYEKLTERQRLEYAPPALKAEILAQKEKEKAEKEKQRYIKTISQNSALADLLPRYTINCKKCGQGVKCHYTWFDQSTVLCPSCYSTMTAGEIEDYHKKYKVAKPPYAESPLYKTVEEEKVEKTVDELIYSSAHHRSWNGLGDPEVRTQGGRWSSHHIMTASDNELAYGVRIGKVSKIRAKIEMKRRQNKSFFSMMPEDSGSPMAYFSK